jgi:hypothetical protein
VIRGVAPRSRAALFQAIGYALNQVTPTECAHYLADAGYQRSAYQRHLTDPGWPESAT